MTDLVQKFRKILEDYHKPMTWENAPVIGKEKADFQKYAPQWLSEAADEIGRLQGELEKVGWHEYQTTIATLREALEASKIEHWADIDAPAHSCALSEYYIGSAPTDVCNCGADEHNGRIQKALAATAQEDG